jgi:ketosteroid isomerase-like protein
LAGAGYCAAVSRQNIEIVRKPLRVRDRSTRTLDQRLILRFPRLAAGFFRFIGGLSAGSRFRQAAVWRTTRLGFEAFNRRDVDAFVAGFRPNFEFYPPREFVEAGFFEKCYRGRSGYRQYVSTWSDVVGRDFRLEPLELIDLGDRRVIVAKRRTRAQASGVPGAPGRIATVLTIEHGKVIRVQVYSDHAEALETVGLRE